MSDDGDVKNSTFLRKIQLSEVKNPTQRGFSLKQWAEDFKKCTSNFDDIGQFEKGLRIFYAGIWANELLDEVRKRILEFSEFDKKYYMNECYISFANREFSVVKYLTNEKIKKSKEVITAGALAQSRIENSNGFEVCATGAVESLVDILRFPLSMTSNKTKCREVKDDEALNVIQARLQLAAIYDFVYDTWYECLWNEFKVYKEKDVHYIEPQKSEKALLRLIGEHRNDLLYMEMITRSQEILSRYEIEFDLKVVIDITVCGGKIKPVTGYTKNKTVPNWYSSFVTIEEGYWDELLVQNLPKLDGVNIRILIRVLQVLRSFGEECEKKFPVNNEVFKLNKLKQYLQVIEKHDLCNAISECVGVDLEVSIKIVNFLTRKDEIDSDMWTRPFVQMSNSDLSFVLPTLTSQNLVRTIEYWMKEGGVDLKVRGDLFERHIRSEVKNEIDRHEYLNSTTFHKDSLFFKVDSEFEQIDFLWIVENVVLVGEVKCTFMPANPVEKYSYYMRLKEGAGQAKRKAEFVKNNLSSLFEKIGHCQMECEYEVKPLLISNFPYYVGGLVDGCPVTDQYLLLKYISGKWEFGNKDIGLPMETISFHECSKTASSNLFEYLCSPPKIKLLKKMISVRYIPLLKINETSMNVIRIQWFVDETLLVTKYKGMSASEIINS